MRHVEARGRLGIWRAPDHGHRCGAGDVVVLMERCAARRLEPAAQRASFTVYPLFADAKGSARSAAPNRRWSRRHPIMCCPARACSAFRSRRFADTVIGFPGVRHRADDDGRRQVFHQSCIRDVWDVSWRAAKVCIFASGLLGMMSGSIISNVADRVFAPMTNFPS